MKSIQTSFVDSDWTGLTHEQIYRQIEAELEEQIYTRIVKELEERQCKGEEHLWTLNICCKNCGEQFNLEFNLSLCHGGRRM